MMLVLKSTVSDEAVSGA